LTAAILAASPSMAGTCARPKAGTVIAAPTDLYSQNGVLNVALNYETQVGTDNRTLFCFVTPTGIESPTLHVNPGDTLTITLHDSIPKLGADATQHMLALTSNICGASTMNAASVNMHFHGTNTSPACHGDDVATLVNSGGNFTYTLVFPTDEPSGLYWYHPHVHGIAESAVLGGASGAIIVDGIQTLQPALNNLPVRELVVRDQTLSPLYRPGGNVPSWDLSLNYVPISYPANTPSLIQTSPGQREFWRVLNADADTILDLQVVYDGVPQPLQLAALDGVVLGSQDGLRQGKLQTVTDIFLPPAGRAEFIVTTPSSSVTSAQFNTLAINTGAAGDSDPARPLATIQNVTTPPAVTRLPTSSGAFARKQRFEGLDTAKVTATRNLFFSEQNIGPSKSRWEGNFDFFITVQGATPVLYSPTNPPAITTTQGAVEDWTIQNQTEEVHEFHIHQIHFLTRALNGVAIPADQQQYRDTFQVPAWSGTGPYPSVTVRMDFRGNITGDFVYHCHILGHEDNGMMATIRVLPASTAKHTS